MLQFSYMLPVSPNTKVPANTSLFQNLFVRYGTGSTVAMRITQWKYWNAFAWTTIVVGTLAWAVAIAAWNF